MFTRNFKISTDTPGLKAKIKVLHDNFTVGGVSKNFLIWQRLFWENSALGAVCLGGSYAVAAVTHQRHDTWQLAGALGVALSALFKL